MEEWNMDAINLIPKLLRSCVEGDRKMIENTTLMIIRKIKKEYPQVAADLSETLINMGISSGYARAINMQPLPVDKETRFSLATLEEASAIPNPILDDNTFQQLVDFVEERESINKFVQAGIVPPNSIMLSGQPGVGKTYIAHWISGELKCPLVTLDLATSISSYLGRTGQNIRSIFDYAKSQATILFLDEIDAIAKTRDDVSDLGELRRLVNVLLKEIEDYPCTGIIIGATNHPELLDKAIWRRFDRSITIEMPGLLQRKLLLKRHLDNYASDIRDDVLDFIAKNAEDINAADICKLCEHIKRQLIIYPQKSIRLIAISELFKLSAPVEKEQRQEACNMLKKYFPDLTQREISQITQIPLTTVSRYLSKQRG